MIDRFKALIAFGRLKDDELLVLATKVVGAMTGNENFPTPTPGLESVQDVLDNYVTRLVTWRQGTMPEERALKDESRILLEEELQALVSYVNTTAKGRLAVVLSSGFPISDLATVISLPYAVEWLRANNTRQSGQIRLDFQAQKRVNHYEYSYRKIVKPEEDWSDHVSTSSSRDNIIANLEAGKYYALRARAVNRQGAGDWSQPVKLLVR